MNHTLPDRVRLKRDDPTVTNIARIREESFFKLNLLANRKINTKVPKPYIKLTKLLGVLLPKIKLRKNIGMAGTGGKLR